ncbi:hypothetical protein HZS61_011163 [Fusarium oxysporum f. sp. conglutinans]|uniref:Peptidase M16 middle/third domain-containing protein n=1 Tax=Fusarium oxysporum f. sp. conglutinans TaxID=100902 RepID=A0A8H6GVY2_FUSOX|nr:hypothetical protein HZS61_011163 [Fusarium oxysporum f. sp. conglutinans]
MHDQLSIRAVLFLLLPGFFRSESVDHLPLRTDLPTIPHATNRTVNVGIFDPANIWPQEPFLDTPNSRVPHAEHEEQASTPADGVPMMMLVTDSLKKPSLNDRDYRVIRLNNELEALRMHDSETDKVSAALDINVGNFSDESDISGTAHAVEHEFMFATQPSRYISHLIGHEGPGSIMSYIRPKGWANSLNAGAYPVCPGTPGIFDVQVRLTEDGLKNYPEIVKILFPRFTSRISLVMQKTLPREWLLGGHSRLREFAPDQIEKALATIRPDNSCMVIVSQYRHDKIPDDLMQECKKAFAVSPQDRLPTLHLPHKNQFIPNEPEVEKQEMDEQALNPRVPRANVIVSLKTPLFYASAENNVKARLFLDLVRDALEMYSYDAELAGLQYKVSLDSRGLFLDVTGYNDKLPVLLDQIFTTMRDLDIKKYPQRDAAQIKLLTKLEVMEFFNRRLNPVFSRRDRLSIHLQAQGKAEGVDKRQEEAQKNANM